jgi:hypothetical protein
VSISGSALQTSITGLQTSVSNLQSTVASIPTLTNSSDSGIQLLQDNQIKRLSTGPGLSASSTSTGVSISFNPTLGNGYSLWDGQKLLGIDVSGGMSISAVNDVITINPEWLGVRLTTAERDISRIADRNSPDVKSIDGSTANGNQYWKLGTWNAPQGGHMLRLRVTYCGYGYRARYGTKNYYQPIDLNILIHTLDGFRLPTNTGFQSGAWGYAWFICGYAAPAFVYVDVNPNNNDSYDIYLNTTANPGHILVEASTTAAWTPGVTRASNAPMNPVYIQCIPVWTHMSTTSTYQRSPPTMDTPTAP